MLTGGLSNCFGEFEINRESSGGPTFQQAFQSEIGVHKKTQPLIPLHLANPDRLNDF